MKSSKPTGDQPPLASRWLAKIWGSKYLRQTVWCCPILAIIFCPLGGHAATTLKGYLPTAGGMAPDYLSQVNFKKFTQNAYQRQKMDEWCWAASISMVFSYYGHPVSQNRIVAETFGSIVDLPAQSGATIVRAMNRTWVDDNGKPFRSEFKAAFDYDNGQYGLNNAMLISELSKGHPVIMGAGSHAVVLTAMEYLSMPGTPINLIACGVFDPWPGRGARGLTPAEMTPINFGGALRFVATFKIEDVEASE